MFPETIEFFRSIRHDECLFFDGKYTLEFVFFRSRQIQHLLNAEWVLSILLCTSYGHFFYVLALISIFPYSVLQEQ